MRTNRSIIVAVRFTPEEHDKLLSLVDLATKRAYASGLPEATTSSVLRSFVLQAEDIPETPGVEMKPASALLAAREKLNPKPKRGKHHE